MRRRALLLVALLVLGGASDAHAAKAKPKPCAKGTVTWTLAGKASCRAPLAARAPTATAPDAQALVARGLRLLTTAPAKGRKGKLPAKARKRLRANADALGAFAGRAELAAAAKRPAGTRHARAAVAIAPQSFTKDGITATVSASVGDDGVATISLGIDGGGAKVGVDMQIPSYIPGAPCPTATGVVGPATNRESMSMTLAGASKAMKVKITTVDVTTGQVGADGVLKTVTTTREQQVDATVDGRSFRVSYSATASGAPGQTGTVTSAPTVKANANAASWAAADGVAGKGAQSVADGAARANDLITRQRANWESLDANKCVAIAWDPELTIKMAPTSTRPVTGTQVLKQGGAKVAATWTVGGPVTRGSFTGGAGGAFTATAAAYEESTFAVVANGVVAASPAGRVARAWLADFEKPTLPRTFDVSFHVLSSTMGGVSEETFTGTASYAREGGVQQNPDGSLSGWYPGTQATLSAFHISQDLAPCRYEASTSGGSISGGTNVELQKAADGSVSYGFTVFIDIPPYTPVLVSGPTPQCPGTLGLQKGQRAVLQARRAPSSDLYAAPPGALTPDGRFHDRKESERGTLGNQPGFTEEQADWEITGTP